LFLPTLFPIDTNDVITHSYLIQGAGTAIGELPPYFMARAATLSGIDPDDEDYDEAAIMFDEDAENDPSLSTRAKLAMKRLVQRVGFFGILLCASVSCPYFFNVKLVYTSDSNFWQITTLFFPKSDKRRTKTTPHHNKLSC